MNCSYRFNTECRFSKRTTPPCTLCLAGMQIDSIELLTSAIMDIRIDVVEESLCENKPLSDYNRMTGQNIRKKSDSDEP